MTTPMNGKNLKKFREKMLMSRKELANKLGVAVQTVGVWERKSKELIRRDYQDKIETLEYAVAAQKENKLRRPAVFHAPTETGVLSAVQKQSIVQSNFDEILDEIHMTLWSRMETDEKKTLLLAMIAHTGPRGE